MAAHFRVQAATGLSLSLSLERLADGHVYDFNSSAFTGGAVTTRTTALTEMTPNYPGAYKLDLSSTPSNVFTTPDYVAYIFASGAVAAVVPATIIGGDSGTVAPPPNFTALAIDSSTGGMLVHGYATGVVLPVPDAHTYAIECGTASIDPTTRAITWHDPGTTTPRVVMTPDGAGGYTSTLL